MSKFTETNNEDALVITKFNFGIFLLNCPEFSLSKLWENLENSKSLRQLGVERILKENITH